MMEDNGDGFDLIREALRIAIERETLRGVAVRVGMSPTGLQKFVAGSRPTGKTREKTRAWFHREAGLNRLATDDAEGVLRQLVGTLPEPDRGVRRLLDSVEAAYFEAGMWTPEWVRRVRQQVRAGRD